MSHPPGALYQIINASILANRKLWKLGDPVRLLFNSPWERGNELFDWYNHRATRVIETIQLRKEQEPPFHHEFLAFSLRNNAGCFRVDRRQRPNEALPLAAIYSDGVEAFDTIDDISSLDDRVYGASDCLIEITFHSDLQVHLGLLLKICQAIAQHQYSKVYTLQRYSCTFYSQTIILCILQDVVANILKGHSGSQINEGTAIRSHNHNPESGRTKPFATSPATCSQNYPRIDFVTHEDQCLACWKLALARRAECRGCVAVSLENLSGLFWDGVTRVAEHFIGSMNIAEDSQDGAWFLSPKVHLIERCQELTYQAIRDAWDTRLQIFKKNLACPRDVSPLCTGPCQQYEVLLDSHRSGVQQPLSDKDKVETDIYPLTWGDLEAHHPELAIFFDTKVGNIHQALRRQVLQICQGSETFNHKLSNYYKAINQIMGVRIDIKRFGGRKFKHEISQMSKEAADTWPHSDLVHQWIKAARVKRSGRLRECNLDMLQLCLLLLLRAHGIRIQALRIWFRCDAAEVMQDITRVMRDVWVLLKEPQESQWGLNSLI